MKQRWIAVLLLLLLVLNGCAKDPPAADPPPPEDTETTAPGTVDAGTPEAGISETAAPAAPVYQVHDVRMHLPDPYGLGWNEPCVSAYGTAADDGRATPAVLTVLQDAMLAEYDWREETLDGWAFSRTEPRIVGLRDTALAARIEDDIRRVYAQMWSYLPDEDELSALLTAFPTAEALDTSVSFGYNLSAVGALCCVDVNGYYCYSYYDAEGEWLDGNNCSLPRTMLYYDLTNGQALTLGELFSTDFDYMAALNRALRGALEGCELIYPFAGLPKDYRCIRIDPSGIQVDLSSACPYLNRDSWILWEYGTVFSLDPMTFFPHMPLLRLDSADYAAAGIVPDAWAPPQFAPQFRGGERLLAGGSEEYPALNEIPLLVAGADDDVIRTVNSEIERIWAEISVRLDEMYEYRSNPTEDVWSSIMSEYQVVGPYLCLTFNYYGGDGLGYRGYGFRPYVFDLRSGRRMRAAELLADAQEARDWLTQAHPEEAAYQGYEPPDGPMSGAQADAVLAGDLFVLGGDLRIYGTTEQDVSWDLPPELIDRTVFEKEFGA